MTTSGRLAASTIERIPALRIRTDEEGDVAESVLHSERAAQQRRLSEFLRAAERFHAAAVSRAATDCVQFLIVSQGD